MRIKKIKIDGTFKEFRLVAGIPRLAKVYYFDNEYYLEIKNKIYNFKDETNKNIVFKFVNLRYFNNKEAILNDFKKLCETTKPD